MTLPFAQRNNANFPRARRTTMTAVNNKLAYVRTHGAQHFSNLEKLLHLASDLKIAFNNHEDGKDTFNAQIVYEYCIAIAVQGIRLAEEGTKEFSYASDAETGQFNLFRGDK